MSEKKIVWEKWIDPLNKNIDEVEYPGFNLPAMDDERPIEFLSEDPNFGQKMEEQLDQAENQDINRNIDFNPIRIVSTPHGFVSLTEHSFASKHFDFWTLHYNRDITDEILEAVSTCDGVETVTPLTRYRMRVGFNRTLLKSGAFKVNSIRKNVENTIVGIDKEDKGLNILRNQTNDNSKKDNK